MSAVSHEDARRWMEAIADHPAEHKLAVSNVVKRYRRLGKWMKLNAEHLGAHVGVSAAYTMGVVGRILELEGGTLGPVSDAGIAAAASQVAEAVDALLPVDEHLPERLRLVEWRAEPGILDALIEDVFAEDSDAAKPPEVMFQVFVLVWVAVEVLSMASTR